MLDEELAAEMSGFLDGTLLAEFARDQSLTYEARFEPVAGGCRCTLLLSGREMPATIAQDEQSALDQASIQAIELLTRGDLAPEPELVLG